MSKRYNPRHAKERDSPYEEHCSARGVQYLSIRYTNRLEAANLKASVGTTGDSYDNALAETVNGLYKTEVIEYLKADWQKCTTCDIKLGKLVQ